MITSGLLEGLEKIIVQILSILPDSPFRFLTQNETLEPYLAFLNWVIPFDFMISTFQAWLVAFTLYFIWSVALRWFRAIE